MCVLFSFMGRRYTGEILYGEVLVCGIYTGGIYIKAIVHLHNIFIMLLPDLTTREPLMQAWAAAHGSKSSLLHHHPNVTSMSVKP